MRGRISARSSGEEFVRVHREQAGEYREKAHGVECEAEACAGERNDDSAQRRADDPGPVEQARVECHGVRKLARADHPVGQRLAGGGVEHEHGPAQAGEEVDDPRLDEPEERQHGERGGEHHRGRLRPDH